MTRSIRLTLCMCLSLAFACGDDDEDTGGSSKCQEANDILKACNAETEDFGSCGAAEQKAAQCIVDHKVGACTDDFDNPDVDALLSCLAGG